MFAFCHLLLTVFNNVGQKKLTETSVKKQVTRCAWHTASSPVSQLQDNLHHPSVKTHFIRVLFKPFSHWLNETSTRSNKQCVWNQSEAMKISGLGLGFLARDKIKLKRVRSRLQLEFQDEVLFCFIWWTWWKSKKCASVAADLHDRRGKMFKVLD